MLWRPRPERRARCAPQGVWDRECGYGSAMKDTREGRAFARDTLDHRPHDVAIVLTEIPGIVSALLGEDGVYIVRYDRSQVTDDALLATLDREGLEVVGRDDLDGDPDAQARAGSAGGRTSASHAGEPVEDTIAVLLRGGPLDGESRLVHPDALSVDEPLTVVERDASEQAEAPGVVGVMEYLYRGDGVADYVGGLPADEPTN